MKFLVTGAAGFIGSHIIDALVVHGHEAVGVDNLASGKKERLNPKAVFHQVDITDLESFAPLCNGVAGIFHTAALARIQPSFKNPDLYFEVNAVGTKNILKAAKKHGVKRVVYSASSSAYGPAENLPLKEDFKVAAQSLHPYGSTKRMGEMLMRDLGRATGGPETVCLRYFNVYGPRQTTTADGPYATAIGIFLGLAKTGQPLTIVPSGYQKRDFTWVGDVVRANLLAMESLKVGDGEIINVGSGQNYSIWDVVRFILGVPPETKPEELLASGKCVFAPERRGEVMETLADISKAKELLGWQPKVILPDGIKQLLQS